MPCGYYCPRPRPSSRHSPAALFRGDAAARSGAVFAVERLAYFSRPGPRIVDGLEILAWAVHPESFLSRRRPDCAGGSVRTCRQPEFGNARRPGQARLVPVRAAEWLCGRGRRRARGLGPGGEHFLVRDRMVRSLACPPSGSASARSSPAERGPLRAGPRTSSRPSATSPIWTATAPASPARRWIPRPRRGGRPPPSPCPCSGHRTGQGSRGRRPPRPSRDRPGVQVEASMTAPRPEGSARRDVSWKPRRDMGGGDGQARSRERKQRPDVDGRRLEELLGQRPAQQRDLVAEAEVFDSSSARANRLNPFECSPDEANPMRACPAELSPGQEVVLSTSPTQKPARSNRPGSMRPGCSAVFAAEEAQPARGSPPQRPPRWRRPPRDHVSSAR